MVKLGISTRWKIVHLMEHSNGDMRYTAKHTPCHIRAVRRWWNRYVYTKDVADAPRSGRPALLSNNVGDAALDMMLSPDTNGAAQVAQQLAPDGATPHVVSANTIIRAARRAAVRGGKALIAKRGKPGMGMVLRTKTKRVAYAQPNLKRNFRVVMFTDRKRFYFRYPGSKVRPITWTLKGEEQDLGVYQPTNPQCVNVYAGITPFGMTAWHVVAGTSKHKTVHKTKQGKVARNITKSEYQEVLEKTLLPEGRRLFTTQGISTWYLQQDNDPTHGVASHVIRRWNIAHGSSVKLLPNWPPNSPDLNIIENVWAWAQQQVNKKGCKDFDEFYAAVKETTVAVPQQMISNLYKSLENRLQLVMKNEGGPTGY